ncbi:cell death regulator Aven [Macrotis lagotis]|uniref:cell death regulator Aven n=1 Tax=Macrotis lagotis TaxID=92651 RepID=UPI003D69B7B6
MAEPWRSMSIPKLSRLIQSHFVTLWARTHLPVALGLPRPLLPQAESPQLREGKGWAPCPGPPARPSPPPPGGLELREGGPGPRAVSGRAALPGRAGAGRAGSLLPSPPPSSPRPGPRRQRGAMQAERGARGSRGRRRPERDRDRDRDRPGQGPDAGLGAAARGGGDGGGGGGRGGWDRGRGRGRGRGGRGARGGRGGGGGGGGGGAAHGPQRGGRREQRGPDAGPSELVEGDATETYEEENNEWGNYSRRKIVSNWDRYQDFEKEAENESGESQRGTDFSVLLSSAGDSFSQFRFAEEKEWDSETSSPKQISALYVDCESLVRALQELPLSLRLNVAAELVQATAPLELPQMKPKKMEDGKGQGMQMRWPLGPSSDVISDAANRPVSMGKDGHRPCSSEAFQKITPPLQQTVDHLDEELDLLLNLDAPVKEEENTLTALTYQDPQIKKDGKIIQENVPEILSVTEEKCFESAQPPCTSKNVTEEELEDWLDSMIS